MKENTAFNSKYTTNVTVVERIASFVGGALLIINALTDKDKFTAAKAAAGGYLLFRGATGHCDIYEAAGQSTRPDPVKNINFKTVLFVNKPRKEVYAFWRKLDNLPLFMQHLKSVKKLDKNTSKWKAWLPGNIGTISWKAEIVKDEPGKLIGWNSLPGSKIDNAGKVEFRDVDGGTELRILITYRAPLGIVGAGITSLFSSSFESIIEKDVKSFKSYIETGVVVEN